MTPESQRLIIDLVAKFREGAFDNSNDAIGPLNGPLAGLATSLIDKITSVLNSEVENLVADLRFEKTELEQEIRDLCRFLEEVECPECETTFDATQDL